MGNKTKPLAAFASIHTRLIGMPLILFIGALVLDIVHSLSQNHTIAVISSIVVVLGIPIAILDSFFGFLHRLALPSNTHARQMAWVYETLNLVLLLLFIFSWTSRSIDAGFVSFHFILTLSYVGILLGTLSLWLGGEMLYGFQTDADSSHSRSGLQNGNSRKRIHVRHTGRYSHRSA